MKIPNLDIYRKDWLDIVFENRNQAYGAYALRKSATKAMNTALMAVLTTVILLITGYNFAKNREAAPPLEQQGEVTLMAEPIDEKVEEVILEPIEQSHQEAPQQIAQDPPAMDLVRYPEAKVVSADKATEELATQDELKGEKMPASISLKKVEGGSLVPAGEFGPERKEGKSRGSAAGMIDGGEKNEVLDFRTVQVMPAPIGGMQAFVKWFAENYHFPSSAVDNNIQGTIEVSFVVDTDGSLTDFVVKRDMGYGTGEEAKKLLGKAKKWNPGVQNGRPVRVAFSMPIRLSTIQQ